VGWITLFACRRAARRHHCVPWRPPERSIVRPQFFSIRCYSIQPFLIRFLPQLLRLTEIRNAIFLKILQILDVLMYYWKCFPIVSQRFNCFPIACNYFNMSYSCKIIIRDDYVKTNGTCALALQIIIDRKKIWILIKLQVKPNQFKIC
jgi:hypothetical protein